MGQPPEAGDSLGRGRPRAYIAAVQDVKPPRSQGKNGSAGHRIRLRIRDLR